MFDFIFRSVLAGLILSFLFSLSFPTCKPVVDDYNFAENAFLFKSELFFASEGLKKMPLAYLGLFSLLLEGFSCFCSCSCPGAFLKVFMHTWLPSLLQVFVQAEALLSDQEQIEVLWECSLRKRRLISNTN